MEKEKEYKEYVKERWKFATEIVEDMTKEGIPVSEELSTIIFRRLTSPHYYFLQNYGEELPDAPKREGTMPSEKQINFAKQLGIEHPEEYTKAKLSKEIDQKLAEEKNK
jgi:hypothetical protein